MSLTKAQILAGSKARKTVSIEGLGDVLIRPLTDAEWGEVEMVTLKSLKIGTDTIDKAKKSGDAKKAATEVLSKTDVSAIATAQLEAARIAVAYGLSVDEEWTVEDVKQLRAGIVHAVATEVMAFTGADTTYADLVPFREKSRRGGDRRSPGTGAPSGTDAEGPDEATG